MLDHGTEHTLGPFQAATAVAPQHRAGFVLHAQNAAATRLETAPKHGVYAGPHTAGSDCGFSGRGNHALSGPFGLGRTSAAGHRAWNRRGSHLGDQKI